MGIRDLLPLRRRARSHFEGPPGQRWYAIGDVHGCYDLLDQLIRLIDLDDEQRGESDTHLLFLGDYIDRGPDSRSVIELAMKLDIGQERVISLMGNHEETLLATANGDRRAATLFHKMGGRETLMSYGVSAEAYDNADAAGIIDLVRAAVPAQHLAWLRNLPPSHLAGDYLFVHAGIRPGVPLSSQLSSDLRWIRSGFLDSSINHGVMVVHGHSVSSEIDSRANRIGIDTGAYASGRLTAIGIEGADRWFLQTGRTGSTAES
jgi:serine/threonine protein phosphatase 1